MNAVTATTRATASNNNNSTTVAAVAATVPMVRRGLPSLFAGLSLAEILALKGKDLRTNELSRAYARDSLFTALGGSVFPQLWGERFPELGAAAPQKNSWKGMALQQVYDLLETQEVTAIGLLSPKTTKTTKTSTSELERARKYIKGLTPETLLALRKEKVI
jgi:hypothetical protein